MLNVGWLPVSYTCSDTCGGAHDALAAELRVNSTQNAHRDFCPPKSIRPIGLGHSPQLTRSSSPWTSSYIALGCKFMPASSEFEVAVLATIWTTFRLAVELSMPVCGQATEVGQAVARWYLDHATRTEPFLWASANRVAYLSQLDQNQTAGRLPPSSTMFPARRYDE